MENLPVINVWYDPPPGPCPKDMYWTAEILDEQDETSARGYGANAEEAVAEFLAELAYRGDTRQEFHVELGHPWQAWNGKSH